MTSKERVRKSFNLISPDRVPANFECVPSVMKTIFQPENYKWPDPDWFDYESIKYQCDRHKNKAIIIGHEGPFQIATNCGTIG
ncbi:hypothetical protein [Clostridium grantii]|uniref:Uncharacterized protein n=1 Tax=Clostridium grantii DSM 8605 TaxID=1121316 RepID=A0A1M5XX14_9CLOT|nr:hypothetical protein [Clostridium grantii]SHI03783.1 hypothetical protein SAMN02745207_03967 [Clostridium grantii DSM 8605]